MVKRGVGTGGKGRRNVDVGNEIPGNSLVKAFGTDKLIQEDPPSQKAGVTRHTHTCKAVCGALKWEARSCGQCLEPPPKQLHPGIRPAEARMRKEPLISLRIPE